MSILVNENTRLLVQGITGRDGSFHTLRCKEYGTNVVAGVTPGKGGEQVDGIPVYNSVQKVVEETQANVSLIFVPAAFAADAILESADAEIPLIICITEGMPVLDMVAVAHYFKGKNIRLIGPNCPGVISPGGKCKVGIMPGNIHKSGKVGVVSRSGTLTYEAVAQLTELGIGQSTCIGIGGDPIIGTHFVDILSMFQHDDDTDAVIMIGEIGGTREQEAAEFIKREMNKPVVAFVGGATAPPGRRMGHAGAIITGEAATAKAKVEALKNAGAHIAESPDRIGITMQQVLQE